ncbi:hypothetical protein DDE05_10240 [Streptomyces cavourensis]|nr:hypothetical protein DDE05_10240 [Streptomyces cavourensis]
MPKKLDGTTELEAALLRSAKQAVDGKYSRVHTPDEMSTKKRALYAELSEGVSALSSAREGTQTLRTHKLKENAVADFPSPHFPPVASKNVPVTNDASAPASHRIARATSSG